MTPTPKSAAPPRLSAGVVVVRDTPGGWCFLLLRAYRNWDFPKGQVEPGEEPLAAACREVLEETSIQELDFRWGHGYCETVPYSRHKVARYYLAFTPVASVSLPVNPELGRPEHNEYRWVDLNEAWSLCPSRLTPILRWAAGTLGLDP